MRRALTATFVALTLLAIVPPTTSVADETARFDVSIEADLELIPHAAATNYGIISSDRGVTPQPPPDGPGVSFSSDGSATSLPIASSIFLEAESHATASWGGEGSRADASGRVIVGGELGLVTALETDQTITVRTTVRACQLAGSVDNDLAEVAAGYGQVWVGGDPSFGLPGSEEVHVVRFSTRDPPGLDEFGTSFDVHCLTFVDERDIVLPGFTDIGSLEIYPVRLTVAAGGRAISHFRDGQLFAPITLSPDDLIPPSLPVIGLDPKDRFAALLGLFDAAIAAKTLVGQGPGASAQGRAGALRNMLSDAGELIGPGLLTDAIERLRGALKRTDGRSPPPDFVAGPAAEDLAFAIEDLIGSLDENDQPVPPIRSPNQ
jgi:hypothetical protein